MTDKEKQLRQLLALYYQQIELFRRYPEEFEKALGKKGTEEWLDRTLDKVIRTRKELEEFGN
ncbi:MAG: hypothetical protein H6577_20265 [Lewinellaceae bacterium]|nr:hypothetical protein [Saprospiraceae bacterium]MCB9340465.1 hypothetical protein [Lewinellaceae bacterium]